MGLFSLFGKKKPLVSLRIDELPSWLDSYVQSTGMDERLGEFRSDMNNKIALTRSLLVKLSDAQLSNEKIPVRAKHIMKGNREQYIARISKFLDRLKVPQKYSDVASFSSDYSERLEELAGETQKNFFVLKEFFASEVGAVASKIKDMEKTFVDLRVFVERQGLDGVQKVWDLLDSHQSLLHHRDELSVTLKQMRKDMTPHVQQIDKIDARLSSLKSSQRYLHVVELHNRLEGIDNEIGAAAQVFLSKMSTLSRPLRKLSKLSARERVINDYLKSPVDALVADDSLVLVDILSELSKNAAKLGLKDKKLDEVSELITSLDKSWLLGVKSSVKSLLLEKADMASRLKNDSTLMLVREQESWKTDQETKLKALDEEIARMQEELSSNALVLSWQKIRDAVKLLDENVVVKRPSGHREAV